MTPRAPMAWREAVEAVASWPHDDPSSRNDTPLPLAPSRSGSPS